MEYECPKCGCKHLYTDYTRARADCIVRKKRCRYCGSIVWTREEIKNYKKSD
jgi:transcription initiation factor TFIIIB Brf1 subunit/transcription initiation factor TFIIB